MQPHAAGLYVMNTGHAEESRSVVHGLRMSEMCDLLADHIGKGEAGRRVHRDRFGDSSVLALHTGLAWGRMRSDLMPEWDRVEMAHVVCGWDVLVWNPDEDTDEDVEKMPTLGEMV